ncbi:type II toxin-antitoxin system VapC family toxin [Demequina mangrovi]|uniref:Ribonuclease VapC n=1 Tax=Demequina mangrovi TaxID=1043493 RepID=A0A1H6ZET5_9MICO|nr:type II toxin-antitoxin system VapC family toxin [Demequina mangrovi]SEJ51891.1 ribonuclease VapC [Demequina mangrovi]
MIIDTSAIIAILAGEPGSDALLEALAGADSARMSAATLVEVHAVVARRGDAALGRRVDRLLESLGITIAPFDAEQAAIASRGYREYGRGSGHMAGLNLGDCYSYALAVHADVPLLFVGEDFTHTDVRVAPHPA